MTVWEEISTLTWKIFCQPTLIYKTDLKWASFSQFYLQEVERDNRTLVLEVKKRDEKIFELESETSSQKLDIISLRDKLDKVENNTTTDLGDLNRIVSDQKNEIGELKRKLNLALETKRKLESEVESSRFNMETVRIRYENELREKYLSSYCIKFQGT